MVYGRSWFLTTTKTSCCLQALVLGWLLEGHRYQEVGDFIHLAVYHYGQHPSQ